MEKCEKEIKPIFEYSMRKDANLPYIQKNNLKIVKEEVVKYIQKYSKSMFEGLKFLTNINHIHFWHLHLEILKSNLKVEARSSPWRKITVLVFHAQENP